MDHGMVFVMREKDEGLVCVHTFRATAVSDRREKTCLCHTHMLLTSSFSKSFGLAFRKNMFT